MVSTADTMSGNVGEPQSSLPHKLSNVSVPGPRGAVVKVRARVRVVVEHRDQRPPRTERQPQLRLHAGLLQV
eukprot:COSAG01_NODE_858_length_13069_cov_23.641943_13_plen_72_part_00